MMLDRDLVAAALALAAGDTYRPGWLRESGIPLMGGGRIQEAAHRAVIIPADWSDWRRVAE